MILAGGTEIRLIGDWRVDHGVTFMMRYEVHVYLERWCY
jgi:hypothetical protein